MLVPGKISLTLLLSTATPWVAQVQGQGVFCEGHPDVPALLSGQATCIYNAGTGTTQIDLSGSALIGWERFGVPAGGRTVFRFAPGTSGTVINRSSGGIVNINGALEAVGGRLVVANPGGTLHIGPGGSVSAPSLLLTTHTQIPEEALLAGAREGTFGGPAGQVLNRGKILATAGDAIVLGRSVTNDARIEAPSGNALVAAGETVVLGTAPGDLRVTSSGRNSVTQSGTVRGTSIALVAEGNVLLSRGGRTEAPQGKVFFRVGNTGSIVDEGGTVTGIQVINGQVVDAPDDLSTSNEIPTSRTPSVARFPALSPDGRPVVRFTNSAIAGLVDNGKKTSKVIQKKPVPRVLLAGEPGSTTRATSAGTWLRQSSFFGARGSKPSPKPKPVVAEKEE